MIVAGQIIENPQTGERLVFSKTAAETGGEYTAFEAFIAPGGHLPAAHVHPSQSERFEITSGTLTLKIDGRTVEAREGDVVTIEPGQTHNFWNKTDDEVSFKVEVRPALEDRVADRDHVRPRRRRQDEPPVDAEPVPARGDRAPPLRHRAAAGRPRLAQRAALAVGAPRRPRARLRPHLQPPPRAGRRLGGSR